MLLSPINGLEFLSNLSAINIPCLRHFVAERVSRCYSFAACRASICLIFK